MMTPKNAGMNFSTGNFWFAESYTKRCPQCAAETETVTTLGAAQLLDVPIYDIYRKAQAGEIHSVTTSHGLLLICRKSLI